MSSRIMGCLVFMLLLGTASAQKISYKVSFPNAVHHEARISISASNIQLKPALFRMSRSSPGRYATHEFGKNVYDVTATNEKGQPLAIHRIDGDVYEVPSHHGNITVSYTLFANHADGTYAGIDPESIHLNMPAAFMWIKGYDNAPIDITFDIPAENKGVIATQLFPTATPRSFTAPGLQYFLDSPVKIGDLKIRDWTVSNSDGKKYTIRIALEADASTDQLNELVLRTKKIVAEAKAVFGEFPAYETGMYTFIMSVNPYVQGDGMEHRNSTMISSSASVFNPIGVSGVTSHEFFHNWNVERIRPKTLEPFNFEKSNMSHELWFAEGFTQYYGELLLARAGLNNTQRFLGMIGNLVNTKQNTPGASLYSPVHSSNHAVFVDAGIAIDKNNYSNMFTSYYTYGAALALALDLEMQTRYGKTLDSYMLNMWLTHGKNEVPYDINSLKQVLAKTTDAAFAESFFNRYVNGHEAIDYASLLGKAGYVIKNNNEGKANAGMNVRNSDQGKLLITSGITRGNAAYEAGLEINDEILQLDGTSVKTVSDLNQFIQQKKPRDIIEVNYLHRGKAKKTTLTLKEGISISLVDIESLGLTLTDEMKQIRKNWFTSKAE